MLRHLKGMLPSFAKGVREKRVFGRGKAVPVMKARKVCPVCSALFDKINTTGDVLLETKNCERCQRYFDDGCIALVCGDEYAFVKSESLKDLPEKIVRLQPFNMEKIKKAYDAEWKTKEPDAQLPPDTAGTA